VKRFVGLALVFAACAGAAWAQADMMRADANGDGAISRAEAQTARVAVFDRIDANRDGFLSAEERAAAAEAARQRRLARVDADGDGRISRTELANQPMRLFDHFDANNNDVLSGAEIDAMRAAAQRRGR
jgi:hypothetical protein